MFRLLTRQYFNSNAHPALTISCSNSTTICHPFRRLSTHSVTETSTHNQSPDSTISSILDVHSDPIACMNVNTSRLNCHRTLNWICSAVYHCTRTNTHIDTLLAHPAYRRCLSNLGANIDTISVEQLLCTCSFLLQAGAPPTDPVLHWLLRDLTWCVRRMSCDQLCRCLHLSQQHALRVPPTLREVCVRHAQDSLPTLVTDARSLCQLARALTHCSVTGDCVWTRVFAYVHTMLPAMTPAEVIGLFTCLAALNKRAKHLLMAAAYHLCRASDIRLTGKQCVDLLHAFKALNFHDANLIARLETDLIHSLSIDGASSSVIISAVTCAGRLRYSLDRLYSTVVAACVRDIGAYTHKQLTSLLLSLAATDTQTCANVRRLSEHVQRHLVTRDALSLDTVWALCVLDTVAPSVLARFVHSVRDTRHMSLCERHKLQTVGLHAVLHGVPLEGTTAQSVSHTAQYSDTVCCVREQEMCTADDIHRVVTSALNCLAPSPRFMRRSPLCFGFNVQAEILFDTKAGRPVQFNEAIISPLQYVFRHRRAPRSESTTENRPRDHSRIQWCAVCTWTYHDHVIHGAGSQLPWRLTGYCAHTVRLLRRLGYRVISLSAPQLGSQSQLSVLEMTKLLQRHLSCESDTSCLLDNNQSSM